MMFRCPQSAASLTVLEAKLYATNVNVLSLRAKAAVDARDLSLKQFFHVIEEIL